MERGEQEPARLASRIDAVAVFSSGAVVTRLAMLSSRADRVRIDGLPLSLDDGSLRVSIEGAPVTAVDVALTVDLPMADPSLPPHEPQELRTARRESLRLRAAVALRDEDASKLQELGLSERPSGPRGQAPPPTPTAARLAMLDFKRGELERIASERERLAEELRRAELHLEQLQSRREQASSARQSRANELRKAAVVSLRWHGDPPAEGARLRVSYRVPGARWAPTYLIRFDAAMASAVIQVRAVLQQRTGEDWDDARLSVSTADAMAWHDLPELASQRIGRSRGEATRLGWRPPPTGAEALYADFDAALARLAPTPPVASDDQEASAVMVSERAIAFGGKAAPPRKSKRDRSRGGSAKVASKPTAPAVSDEMESAPPAPAGVQRRFRTQPDAMLGELRVGSASEAYGDEDGSGADDAATEPVHVALLDYGALRIAAPGAPLRGQLRPVDQEERLLSIALRAQVSLHAELHAALRDASGRAHEVASLPMPPRVQAASTPQLAYRWDADTPATVPSDGGWHAVPLGEREIPCALTHVTVPRLTQDVFRVAELANPFDAALLAGPAEVYAADRYLMTVDVPSTIPGAALCLGLGIEPGVAVARNASVSEASAGLIGGSLVISHRISTSVANKLQGEISVEVRERIPVPAAGVDDCKIKLGVVTPAWEDWRPAEHPFDGGRRWRVRVSPGATRELVAEYTITIPAKYEIVGGNRREA
jgi:hypothetical protein